MSNENLLSSIFNYISRNKGHNSIARIAPASLRVPFSSRFVFHVDRNIPVGSLVYTDKKLAICSLVRIRQIFVSRQFVRPSDLKNIHTTCDSEFKERQRWTELPKIESDLWVVLGWDVKSWDHGPAPISESKLWNQLSDEEKNAARMLKESGMIPPNHDPQWAKDSFDGTKHFDGSRKQWNELTAQHRHHWKDLGWVEDTFNNGPTLKII